MWCCVVGRVGLSISKGYSVFVFRFRPAKNRCSFLLQHSCRGGWSYSKFQCGLISPLCAVHYPYALNKVSFTEGINVKVVAVCLLHTELIWHQKIFSVVAPCSLADMHRHFGVPATSIIRVVEMAGSSHTMLLIYCLTVAGPRWQATSSPPPWEPQISFYDTQQVLEISATVWLIWDYKFRYLNVHVSSLIVSVSVDKLEGVIVCLWLRSELFTTVPFALLRCDTAVW